MKANDILAAIGNTPHIRVDRLFGSQQPSPHPIQGIGAGFIPNNLTPPCSTA